MANKPASYGADRLFARLDLPNSQYFSEVTRAQAQSLKEKYYLTRYTQNYYLGQVKQMLNIAGVPSILYGAYCAFAGEVAAGREKLGAGTALVAEVALLAAKWTSRGCSASVLETIRTQVFNIGAPVAP